MQLFKAMGVPREGSVGPRGKVKFGSPDEGPLRGLDAMMGGLPRGFGLEGPGKRPLTVLWRGLGGLPNIGLKDK